MLAKRLSWTDFNGKKREQTFYFGLDETDLANYQLSHNGGMTEMLQGMIDAQDNANLAKRFEELILMCYGEKSDDGMYFMKSDEISHKFRCTGAYNALFLEFLKGVHRRFHQCCYPRGPRPAAGSRDRRRSSYSG